MNRFLVLVMSVSVIIASFFPAESVGARGRVKIGVSSKGALTVLSDRGTLLRGKDLRVTSSSLEAESCFVDVRNAGLNCIHFRCEDNITNAATGEREWMKHKQWMDDAIDWCEKYDLYAVIVYSTGNNASFNDGRDKFWEYIAPRYKDRTYVAYEPENESWCGDSSIALCKRIRQWAPLTHIIMFCPMCAPTVDDNTIAEAKAKGIDFSNLSVGYHTYCTSGRPPENLSGWKSAGYALIATEYIFWADLIKNHENAGISWIPFITDQGDHGPRPGCGFKTYFPEVMTSAIQSMGAAKVCWLPDHGSVPGCNTPTQPYFQVYPHTLNFTVEKGTSAPAETIAVYGANLGSALLPDVSGLVSFKDGTDWLSVVRMGSGNQQKIANTILSESMPAGVYNAEVTLNAATVQPAKYPVKLTVLEPRSPDNPPLTTAGLAYSYFQGVWKKIPQVSTLTPLKTGVVSSVSLSPATATDNFLLHFTGYIEVAVKGVYTFYLSSDDGSRMYFGDKLFLNNDSLHGTTEVSDKIILLPGKHAITFDYLEATGEQVLLVDWEGPGIARQKIPASVVSNSGTTMTINQGTAKGSIKGLTLSERNKTLELKVSTISDYKLQLFNITGRCIDIHEGKGSGTVVLGMEQYSAGTYLIRLSSAVGVLGTMVFMIQ